METLNLFMKATAMKISFDSNAWEKVFANDDRSWAPIREALQREEIGGLICEAAFRIEAVRKDQRLSYFSRPMMDLQTPGTVTMINGEPHILLLSFGPDDNKHPGLPQVQSEKLERALSHNCRLMRGLSWLGLPSPIELKDPALFAREPEGGRSAREQRQLRASSFIEFLGVGKAVFDHQGGWQSPNDTEVDQKRFQKSCAEWADGELVAAHIAYKADVICTDDAAVSAGHSVFSLSNRSKLNEEFGVEFMSLRALGEMLST